MLVIGLTGGIATGKSTVTQTLEELGATILSGDALGHEAYLPGKPAYQDLIDTWGAENVLDPETKQVDRRKLGGIVFADPDAMQTLNRIMWPRLYAMVEERLDQWRKEGVKVAVVEAAILIEANWMPLMDEIWVTSLPADIAKERLIARNNLTEEQAMARINSQMPNEERVKHATVVVDTRASIPEVVEQVKRLWRERVEAKAT